MTSKEQIIRAARKVFERFGFSKASMSDIATESRKGRRTIYTHFSGKEEVFFAVIDTEVQKLANTLSELISKDISPSEKLRQYMQIRMNAVKDLTVYYDALREDVVNNLGLMENIRKEYDRMEVEMIKKFLMKEMKKEFLKLLTQALLQKQLCLPPKGLSYQFLWAAATMTTTGSSIR